MVHDVIIGKEKMIDVAKKYGRSIGWVSIVVKRLKNNRHVFQEMIEKHE